MRHKKHNSDQLLFPKAFRYVLLAGLLTCFSFRAFPSFDSGLVKRKPLAKLTAAGTVPDLHRIPF